MVETVVSRGERSLEENVSPAVPGEVVCKMPSKSSRLVGSSSTVSLPIFDLVTEG